MLLLKSAVILFLLIGLLGTFVHKVPGTPLIVIAALLFGVATGFTELTVQWVVVLVVLSVGAEWGAQIIRTNLFHPQVSTILGIDVAAGTFASLILADVICGPLLGLVVWEFLIGKSLMPMIKKSGVLVLSLCTAAMYRFSLASVMVYIIILKIF